MTEWDECCLELYLAEHVKLSWFFRVKCGHETCYRHERFSYELQLISIRPDMIL